MDMDRFVNEENLERFRRLASVSTTEPERKILFGLLADEQAKFLELHQGRRARAKLSRASFMANHLLFAS